MSKTHNVDTHEIDSEDQTDSIQNPTEEPSDDVLMNRVLNLLPYIYAVKLVTGQTLLGRIIVQPKNQSINGIEMITVLEMIKHTYRSEEGRLVELATMLPWQESASLGVPVLINDVAIISVVPVSPKIEANYMQIVAKFICEELKQTLGELDAVAPEGEKMVQPTIEERKPDLLTPERMHRAHREGDFLEESKSVTPAKGATGPIPTEVKSDPPYKQNGVTIH